MISHQGLRKSVMGLAAVCLETCALMAIFISGCITQPHHPERSTISFSTNAAFAESAATGRRQGVGAWNFRNGSVALAKATGVLVLHLGSRYKRHNSASWPRFVPMISGVKRLADIDKAKAFGTTLLGFNEPDHEEETKMTPQQALDLWPQLMATNMRLGSPAPASNAQKRGSWFDQFMSGVKAKGYRVDFICLHRYEKNFADINAAVKDLRTYLEEVHERYPDMPIWLTEFALTNYSVTGAKFPTEDQQAAFATASVKMLRALPYVERYAWFAMPPTKDPTDTRALSDSEGNLTKVGLAYASAAPARN